jgi:hypothetical protein
MKSIGVKIEKKVAAMITIAGVVIAVGIMLACAPPQKIVRQTRASWGENYSYRYELPEKQIAKSLPITIAVVNPFFKDPENALGTKIYSKVGRGFSKSMVVDMDKIIVAKGMTVKGPYADIEDMTFPDKKSTDLTLTPKVFVIAQIKEDEEWQKDFNSRSMIKNFELSVSGWVAFEMREPLSGEKIWIKKLELDEVVEKGEVVAKMVSVTKPGDILPSSYKPGEILHDNKPDAMADALKKQYPTIMEKFWTYINTEEILNLKAKTKEIRDLKRY